MYLRVVHRRYTTDLNNFPRTFLAYFDDDDRQPSSRWIEPIKCTYIYIYIYSVFLLLPSSFLSLPFFVYNTSLYLSCLIPLHILDIYLRDLCPPLPFLRVSVCTSTPYGRSHERDRWNAHRYTHTRARLRAEEPLMNLAVLRPPVRVSPWERTNGKTVSDVYENRISPFFFSSLSLPPRFGIRTKEIRRLERRFPSTYLSSSSCSSVSSNGFSGNLYFKNERDFCSLYVYISGNIGRL